MGSGDVANVDHGNASPDGPTGSADRHDGADAVGRRKRDCEAERLAPRPAFTSEREGPSSKARRSVAGAGHSTIKP